MAIQAEMNMTSPPEVTSRRRRDDVTACQELAAELTTSDDKHAPSSSRLKCIFAVIKD